MAPPCCLPLRAAGAKNGQDAADCANLTAVELSIGEPPNEAARDYKSQEMDIRRSSFCLMGLATRASWVVWLALVVPALLRAETPAPDARQLAVTEAILDYCSRAYPESTEKFQFQVQRLTRGATPETLTKVRTSDDYQQARAAEERFISQVDPHNAKHICAKSLPKGK